MKKQFLFSLVVLFALYTTAQTYTVGNQTITYTDPARSNRSVGVDFRYPGTGQTVATGQFPFVIFAHGFSMDQTPYYPYADSLAKRGYIVGLLTTETGLSPSHANFAQDLLFVYNKLISEGAGNNASPFYNKVIAKGAIGGHSMGGGSTVLSAQYGNPQACSFTFAAAVTNPSSVTAAPLMTKPYLSFAGSLDCIAPIATHQQPMYDSSGSSCKFLINITGGLHCQYGNANSACSFGEGFSGCASSSLTRQQQINKTLHHLIPFLDYYLKGDCDAWTLFESRYTANTADVKQRNCTNTVPSNAAITGNNFFCQGSSTTLTANPTGFQYLWNDNSTGGTLNVNTAGNYSVVVGNGTCSLAAVSASITENLPPATPSAITSANTVCSNISNITISVQNDPAVTAYNWTLPTGWNITGANNTNSIQVISGITGGTISVTAENNCGTTSQVTKTIMVVPSNLGSPGVITGSDTVCAGQTATYSIAPVSGADSYFWSFPSGWVSSQPYDSTAIHLSANAAGGFVTVAAINQCGQSVHSEINVFIHSLPILGFLYGDDSLCLNNTGTISVWLYSAEDADTLIWSVTNPWSIISGQGSSALTVNGNFTGGSASVYAANECGITSTLTFNTIYVDTPQVTISQQGNVLSAIANAAAQYQWYADGVLISGANGASYIPLASGNYSVVVTNYNGCSAQSSPFVFNYTGTSEILNENLFQIFPNPNSTGSFRIVTDNGLIGAELNIFDVTGQLVLQSAIINPQSHISLPVFAKGIYVISVEKNGSPFRRKFVVE